MPSAALRILLLALLAAVLGHPLAAQPAAAPGYTVAGTVVSGLDGHPIEHATVDLLATPDDKLSRSATSDELGRFSFPGVPKGAFVLRGEAPGFLQTRFGQHGQFSTAIITGSTVPTASLTLKLHPLGHLSGTVTDENAESVHNAQVHLYRRDTVAGQAAFVAAGQAQTNDLGEYHFTRLVPGTYYVAVTAAPWYAVHPGAAHMPEGMIGVVPYQDPSLDVAYPVTYYPTGSDPARASAIPVNGNQTHADLQLTPVPALTLTFPRERSENGRPGPIPQLQATIFGQPAFVPSNSVQNGDTVVLNGLAPGDYTYRITGFARTADGGNRAQTSGSTVVHLAPTSPNTLPDRLPSPAHIHVTLQSADGGPLPPNLRVRLLRSEPSDSAAPTPFLPAQNEIEAEPGDYFFGLNMPLKTFVRSVSVNGKPLPSNDLHIAAGDDLKCTVIVGQGSHTLRGFVREHGEPIPGAMLLLIPADTHLVLRKWFLSQSDLDGSFEIPSVPPGPYLLLAFGESGWSAPWRRSDFLTTHLPHSTPVLIPDHGAAQIDLQQPVTLEPL